MPSLRDLALSSSSLKARSVILLVLWILLKGWCTVKSLVNILNFCLILHLFNPCCYRTTGTLKKIWWFHWRYYVQVLWAVKYVIFLKHANMKLMITFTNMLNIITPSLASPPPNSHKGCKVQYNKLKIFSQDQFDIN